MCAVHYVIDNMHLARVRVRIDAGKGVGLDPFFVAATKVGEGPVAVCNLFGGRVGDLIVTLAQFDEITVTLYLVCRPVV